MGAWTVRHVVAHLTGAALDLLLAIPGRPAGLATLEGPGLPLTSRL
jgi:hypothetical protein